MKKDCRMTRTFFVGILVLLLALFSAGCGMSVSGSHQYTFENQTSYIVTVTIVDTVFDIWSEALQDYGEYNYSNFNVDPSGVVKIRCLGEVINFKWTTDSGDNNRKTSVVNNRYKVTFKE
jgi:spore coat protein U-like protein